MSPSPPLFANAHLNNALWHFAFNRLAEVNDQLGHDEAGCRRRADSGHPRLRPLGPEETPEETLAALTTFLAPYRG